MASKSQQLHFVIFPLMAPGHMIPLIDMAKVIAKHGASITIFTTPLNANRIKPTIDHAIEAGLDMKLALVEFPSTDSGLPEGCENVDTLPSLSLAKEFIIAAEKLQEPMEKLLHEIQPKPSCIISDMGFSWTSQVAMKFNIPRIVFHGTCCVSLLSSHNLLAYDVVSRLISDTDTVVVPGLPDRIELTTNQLPSAVISNPPDMNCIREKMRDSENESYGVVVNSFEELEPEYFKRYREAKGKSVWCVGPVSLCNKDHLDMAQRGNKAAIDVDQCFKWLDSHNPESVIYACFGSLSNVVASQIIELGLALEASNRPFILVIRGRYDIEEVERLIAEAGFEERTKGRGLVIKGWAPQVLLLSHLSMGVLLTHCGWNSTLEGICAGLPLLTWPLFAEQFMNEKFVVQVLRVGVSVRVENPVTVEGEEGGGLVAKKDINKAIDLVMDEGHEANERRGRARKLAEMARRAVEEEGSSDRNIKSFIKEILEQSNRNTETKSE